mgnify:CR=1 FL=1
MACSILSNASSVSKVICFLFAHSMSVSSFDRLCSKSDVNYASTPSRSAILAKSRASNVRTRNLRRRLQWCMHSACRPSKHGMERDWPIRPTPARTLSLHRNVGKSECSPDSLWRSMDTSRTLSGETQGQLPNQSSSLVSLSTGGRSNCVPLWNLPCGGFHAASRLQERSFRRSCFSLFLSFT